MSLTVDPEVTLSLFKLFSARAGEEDEDWGLLELRAANRRLCCCGVKRKFGGREPPGPAPADAISRFGMMTISKIKLWCVGEQNTLVG